MDLDTLTMDRTEARKAFLEYRDAIRADRNRDLTEAEERARRADEAIMLGYRALARGQQVIKLSQAIKKGGLMQRTYREWNSTSRTVQLPRIAAIRADARECWLSETSEGTVQFDDEIGVRSSYATRHRITVREVFPRFEFPERSSSWRGWKAEVPHVPPLLRPSRGLSRYTLLFEADWRRSTPPPPPGDPALLKRIGGDLYAVVAVWDLTELEKAVLSQR